MKVILKNIENEEKREFDLTQFNIDDSIKNIEKEIENGEANEKWIFVLDTVLNKFYCAVLSKKMLESAERIKTRANICKTIDFENVIVINEQSSERETLDKYDEFRKDIEKQRIAFLFVKKTED